MKTVSRTSLATLALALAIPSFAADTNSTNTTVSPAERAKIESVVHDYLLKKPEILVEALQILQQKQYEQAEQTVKQTQAMTGKYVNALFHEPNDPTAGNPNGNITIVEFFDYQCPHCIDMVPVMHDIIKANPNVRVVYKEFPIRGPLSEVAARAALAANMQGKYNDFSRALLTANKPLTEDLIYQIAQQSGIDVAKLKKEMNSASVDDQLKKTMKLAQDLKLFGTPAFFIGSTQANAKSTIIYVPGQMNQKQLQSEINKIKQS